MEKVGRIKKEESCQRQTSMEKKTVSVIITTSNRVDMLKRSLESVLNQSYGDFELIVVDDHSTDGTKDYMKSIKDERLVYIRRNKNFGNDTRPKNQGAKVSKGKYLAYLDDDNAFRPDHLQALINEIEKDDRIDVVYGDRIVIDDEGKRPPRIGFTADFSDTLIMKRNYIDTSDVLIRREALFDVGGWDERFKKYVDWNLWVRMTKAGKQFKRVPVVITEYHHHKGMKSLTVKDRTPQGEAPIPLGSEQTFLPEWDPIDVEIEQPYLKEIRSPRIAIFTLTYNRHEYTKMSFESLEKTAGYPYDHFIVDNGSTDGTVKYLQDLGLRKDRKFHIIYNRNNKGISIASNQVIDAIGDGYDIIVKFDNDCICQTNDWLARMVEIWKRNHMLALSPYVSGLRDNPGGAPRVAYGHINNELVGITRHIGGICIFTDARAYKTFRWDEDSFLHGIQDMEFSQYLLFNGWRLAYMENYQVSHGPTGTVAQKEYYPEYFKQREKEKTTRYEKHGESTD